MTRTHRWRIGPVTLNQNTESQGDQPEHQYNLRVTEISGLPVEIGLSEADSELLLKHFKVDHVFDLLRKTFVVSEEYIDATYAFDWFLTNLRHDGHYQAPSVRQIFERTAKALAKMECPDFSDVDSQTLRQAFTIWFSGVHVTDSKFGWLNTEIELRTDNQVFLRKAKIEEFRIQYHGPVALCKLCGPMYERMFVFDPFAPSCSKSFFIFDRIKGAD